MDSGQTTLILVRVTNLAGPAPGQVCKYSWPEAVLICDSPIHSDSFSADFQERKQYFSFSRDGAMFRHILNFMRTGRALLPDDFQDHDLLLEEAKYYELNDLVNHLLSLQSRSRQLQSKSSNGTHGHVGWEVIAVHVSPDLGERILISASRDTLEDLFPELCHTLQDTRQSLSWNSSSKYVIRWGLDGDCFRNFSWLNQLQQNVEILMKIPRALLVISKEIWRCFKQLSRDKGLLSVSCDYFEKFKVKFASLIVNAHSSGARMPWWHERL